MYRKGYRTMMKHKVDKKNTTGWMTQMHATLSYLFLLKPF